MAYQCTKNNKECDGCGSCRRPAETELNCSVCGRTLGKGECYYHIDCASVCGECIQLSRRTA